MRFDDPWLLVLLLLLPLVLRLPRRRARIRFSYSGFLENIPATWRVRARRFLPLLLRILGLAVLIIALARPQQPQGNLPRTREGIDIVLVVDTSTSMKAMDFTVAGKRYNRLYVVKQVVEEFIEQRVNDRIGMIAFAGRPYVVCPLTLDRSWLLATLERVRIGMVEDGTAVGSAMMAGLNRLRHSAAETKIMILLTDGRSNAGKISPLVAAEAARALGIKVYTIGAGGEGMVPFPVTDVFGRSGYQSVEIDLDEESLQQIAEMTGGEYFRATDTASLKQVYEEIDTLERTEFEYAEYTRYTELFPGLVLLGMMLVLSEQVLRRTLLMSIP